MAEEEIGKITHYFNHLNVAIIELAKNLHVSDTIHVKGHTSDFTQPVDSMQIEHESIEEAKSGQVIGVKVKEHVRVGDTVFKVT